MTKEARAYDLLLRWENNPQTCDNKDCEDCAFYEYCDEARKIVWEDSRWNKKNCDKEV